MPQNAPNNVAVKFIVTLALIFIIAASVALAQSPRKIAKVEVEGLQRLSLVEVIEVSGLKTGSVFAIADVDAAGQRLVDSGLFAKVGYQTRTNGNLVTVIFQVEEMKGGQSPVVFDNFVWFTRDELTAAIKREVPSYNGTASDSGNMTDLIKLALQKLLDEKQIKGTVEYAPFQVSLGSKQEHLFSVNGVPIPICTLKFPGAKNIGEEKLVRSSSQLTSADYSLKGAIAFGTFVLSPLYREVGQLRARFDDPIPQLENSEACKGGVNLAMPVVEGPVYSWNKAEWVGNQKLSSAELDSALGMRTGEVANGVKFDKALLEAKKAYGQIGYLNADLQAVPEFDDPATKVSYRITVKEGPQYRMGQLKVIGLTEAENARLEERWRLKPGDVFNANYLGQFLRNDARDLLQSIFLNRQAQGKKPYRLEPQTKPNRQTLDVDVVIDFKE